MSSNFIILAAVFLAVVGLFAGIAFAVSKRGTKSANRLATFSPVVAPGTTEVRMDERREKALQEVMAERIFKPLSKFMAVGGGQSKLVEKLVYAGIRKKGAVEIFLGAKMAISLALPAAIASIMLYKASVSGKPVNMGNLVLFSGAGLILGMIAPNIWLDKKVKARQEKIRFALPNMLDLLVVCVESGLGLDAALVRIGREIQEGSPELSEELALLNLEVSAGKPREECLRNLGLRTGVEEVKSLVACIIQATKFGTNLANSLRIHAESLREKRRQDAEERAAKTTVKLLFPLVFFIFPALFVIILGPAVVKVYNTFVHPRPAASSPR
jgi:tight adherence protein C